MKLEELDSQLEKNQLSGFWRTRVPSHASEAPYLWKWEPLLDGLLKAPPPAPAIVRAGAHPGGRKRAAAGPKAGILRGARRL